MANEKRGLLSIKEGLEVNNNLKAIRERTGKTQKIVAKDLGISESTYRSWERNQRDMSGYSLIKLCKYFDVDMEDVYSPVLRDPKMKSPRDIIKDRLCDDVDKLDIKELDEVIEFVDFKIKRRV